MADTIEVWGETAIGRDHMENQDVIFFPGSGRDPLDEGLIAARGRLLAVASGRGGPGIGRPAGLAAVAALVPAYYSGQDDAATGLRRAVAEAGAAVIETGRPAVAALTAAVIAGDRLHLAYAGGGRAYRLRNGIVEALIGGEDEAARLPIAPGHRQPAFPTAIRLQDGDRVWLCSDALGAALTDDDWRRVLAQGQPRRVASRPIALAREREATGDLSVIVAHAGRAPRFSRAQVAALLALGVVAAGAVAWLVWEVWRWSQMGG